MKLTNVFYTEHGRPCLNKATQGGAQNTEPETRERKCVQTENAAKRYERLNWTKTLSRQPNARSQRSWVESESGSQAKPSAQQSTAEQSRAEPKAILGSARMANGTAGHAWNGKDDVGSDDDGDVMNEAGRAANNERAKNAERARERQQSKQTFWSQL